MVLRCVFTGHLVLSGEYVTTPTPVNRETHVQQECIPVGCILPASVTILGAGARGFIPSLCTPPVHTPLYPHTSVHIPLFTPTDTHTVQHPPPRTPKPPWTSTPHMDIHTLMDSPTTSIPRCILGYIPCPGTC